MNIQTGCRLLLLPLLFGTIGTLVALLLFDDARGFFALIVGSAISLFATELYIPSLLKQWERTGVPGERTPEQQRLWEQEKGKRQRKQNLVVLVGLIVSAILRIYFKEIMPLFIPAIFGGVAAYFLRFMWLIYRKRGKLGP
jgi:FtsH-binding integral membrane protein